ncbi:a-factor receptor [Tulasnella sp. 419]|nr:a-factor receptor [Tulasnella sp. 418]KAG8959588.1 a-factor receptor [Tulasnella sp. 419]
MLDPTYPLYPVLASLSLVAGLLPSPWHWKNRNTGTLLFLGWTVIGLVIYGVDSVVWKGSLADKAPAWCDINTKFMVAMSAAQPAASLTINMRLYYISSIKQVTITSRDNRKRAIIDLLIGVGIPLLLMVFHGINQGHRYDIIENVGCYPSVYVTPVALATIFIWPILLSAISLVYAVLAIRSFLRQRKQFNDILQSANTGLTVNRYFRLMALAGTDLVLTLPFALYIFINNCMLGLNPWISWADTHYNFNRVEKFPWGFFKLFPQSLFMINITRYALVANGFLFFLFFGLAGESGVFYKKWFWTVVGLFGFRPKPQVAPGASWIARPGASGAMTSSIPPFHSVTSQTTSSLPHKQNWSPTTSTTSDENDEYDEKVDLATPVPPAPAPAHKLDVTSNLIPPREPEKAYKQTSQVGNDVA